MGALRARGVVGVIFAGRARYAVLAYALRAPAARGTSAPSSSSLASALPGGALLDAGENDSDDPPLPTGPGEPTATDRNSRIEVPD